MDPLAPSEEKVHAGSYHQPTININGRSYVAFYKLDSPSSSKDDPIYLATYNRIFCQLSDIVEIQQNPACRPIADIDKHSIPFLVANALEDAGEQWESKLSHLLPDIFDVLLFTVQLEGQKRKYKLDLLEHIPRMMKILLQGVTDAVSEICSNLVNFLVYGLKETEEEIFGEAWDSTLIVLRADLKIPNRYIHRLFPVAKQLYADECEKRRAISVMLMSELLYLGYHEKVVKELVPLYVELGCNDSDMYVRREVATCFARFCANLTPQENSDHMVILYTMMVQDENKINRKMAVDAAPTLLFMLRLLKDQAESQGKAELSKTVSTQMVRCLIWITSALKEAEISINICGYKTLGPVLAIITDKRMPGLKCDIDGKIIFDEHDFSERDYFHELASDDNCQDDNDMDDMNEFFYWNITPSLPAKHMTALQKRPPDYVKSFHTTEEEISLVTSKFCFTDYKMYDDTPLCECCLILLGCFTDYIDYNRHRDIAVLCARNLPCIVYTYKLAAWPLLHPLMKILACHDYYKVRQTIAASIHEIVLILGLDITMQDLQPIYIDFLIDMDEVRICAMHEIHKLLAEPRPDIVSFVLQWLAEFADNIAKSDCAWRNKAAVATQLADCMHFFDPKKAMEVASPALIKLFGDKVFFVRNEAIRALARLIILAADQDFIYPLVDQLAENYGKSNRWKDRQACIKAFEEVMNQIDPFVPTRKRMADRLTRVLSQAAHDPVPNVRLVCARIVCLYGNSRNKDIQRVLKNLRDDVDRDVRDAARKGLMLKVSELHQDLDDVVEQNWLPGSHGLV